MKAINFYFLWINIFFVFINTSSQFARAGDELTEEEWALVHELVKPHQSEIETLSPFGGKRLQDIGTSLFAEFLEKIPNAKTRPVAISQIVNFGLELLFEKAPPEIKGSSSGIKDSNFSFPCNLNQLGFYPKVEIIGEHHFKPESRKVKVESIRNACQGVQFLGIEGYTFEDRVLACQECERLGVVDYLKTSRMFGIEDEFAYSLSRGLFDHFSFVDDITIESNSIDPNFSDQIRGEFKIQFFEILRTNTFHRKAWNEIRRPLENAEDEELAKWIDLYLKHDNSSSLSSLITFFQDLKSRPSWSNPLSFIRISHGLGKQLVNYLEKDEFKIHGITSETYSQVLDYPLHHLSPQFGSISDPYKTLGQKLTVETRNLSFARNAAHLYCEASREKKDLILIVGALHAEALKQLLLQSSGGRVDPIVK